MDATTVDRQLAALRDDDGALERALVEMDAKLAAWLAAMKTGQTALLACARRIASEMEGEAAGERAAAGQPAPPRPPVPARGVKLFRGEVPTAVASERDSHAPETAAAPPKGEPATSEDDEALLASLDTDTARAIQVKRRLTNNGKSVRELLEEMRSPGPRKKDDSRPAQR